MSKLWLKNRLERLMVARPLVVTRVLKRSEARHHKLQIIMPHRLNWRLTTATLHAFQRLTVGEFSFTLVVNFDEVPSDWEGWKTPNLTIVQNRFSFLGHAFRKIFKSENGSMFNALALDRGLNAEPDYEWAFVAHSDSAPLLKGWNEHFTRALQGGFVAGNLRDTFRVFAAHSSGTLFQQREFRRRGGTVWPRYRRGVMEWDVSDGISMALKGEGLVPVLPNNLQSPELSQAVDPSFEVLKKFVEGGTNLTFAEDRRTPIFAHMGRGTPRSLEDPYFSGKPPVNRWIEWIESLR